MVIHLKVKGTGSWLDPRSMHALSANLSYKLWQRCKGHRGLFVTLTYRRDEYNDAQDLYRRQSDEQHVPLFLRKISRVLGEKLTGRWFCKMEFQKDGWVHWHILILDVPKIDHAKLTQMWGRGHVWVRRLSRRNVKYCTKYTSKGGDVPAWLLGERSRSVKVVRVSPGFWSGEPIVRGARDPAPSDPLDMPRQRYDFYVPIGEKIERYGYRFVAHDTEGRYIHGEADLGPLLAVLLMMNCGIVGKHQGWLVVDGDLADLEVAIERAEAARSAVRKAAPAASAFHLIQPSNPDAPCDASWPVWLRRWMFEHVQQEMRAA